MARRRQSDTCVAFRHITAIPNEPLNRFEATHYSYAIIGQIVAGKVHK